MKITTVRPPVPRPYIQLGSGRVFVSPLFVYIHIDGNVTHKEWKELVVAIDALIEEERNEARSRT